MYKKRALLTQERRDVLNQRDKCNRISLKNECMEAYGGAKCYCCGESHFEMLSIDHINSDGADERRAMFPDAPRRSGGPFYRKLKQLGFPNPERYRVACQNCNMSASYYQGVCVHQHANEG